MFFFVLIPLCSGYGWEFGWGCCRWAAVPIIPKGLDKGEKTAGTGLTLGGCSLLSSFFLTTQAGSLSLSLPRAGISVSGQQQPGVTALLCVSSLPRIPNSAPFSAF